jgi:hypothetical protein
VPQRIHGNFLCVGLLAVVVHLLIKALLTKVVVPAKPNHPLCKRLNVERLQPNLPNCATRNGVNEDAHRRWLEALIVY